MEKFNGGIEINSVVRFVVTYELQYMESKKLRNGVTFLVNFEGVRYCGSKVIRLYRTFNTLIEILPYFSKGDIVMVDAPVLFRGCANFLRYVFPGRWGRLKFIFTVNASKEEKRVYPTIFKTSAPLNKCIRLPEELLEYSALLDKPIKDSEETAFV